MSTEFPNTPEAERQRTPQEQELLGKWQETVREVEHEFDEYEAALGRKDALLGPEEYKIASKMWLDHVYGSQQQIPEKYSRENLKKYKKAFRDSQLASQKISEAIRK